MLLGLSEALSSLVEAKFKSAKAARGLIFSPTELAIINTSTGLPFQLRYCPSLAKKPEPRKETATPKKKSDPFNNPSADLLVAEIPRANPSHFLILNKFPIIAEHFILATKANKHQTHVLEQDDLEATYACLKAWEHEEVNGKRKRLFAFFNSGEHSGASQPHRHLQFIPLEHMQREGQCTGWELLLELILTRPDTSELQQPKLSLDPPQALIQHPSIPFEHFGLRFPQDPTGLQLLNMYKALYRSAKETVEEYICSHEKELNLHDTTHGDLPISYNMAMTTMGMVIMPRRNEGCMLHCDDGTDIGFVALNGTTLGGTLMVKHQEEWDVLRTQPQKLDLILETIGIPRKAKL